MDSKKQTEKKSINKRVSVSKLKKPIDDFEVLEFSITKDAIPYNDYKSSGFSRRSSDKFDFKKRILETKIETKKDLEKKEKKEESKIIEIKNNQEASIKVRNAVHNKSRHTISLAPKSAINNSLNKVVEKDNIELENKGKLEKEVERIRSESLLFLHSRKENKKIAVNFLDRKKTWKSIEFFKNFNNSKSKNQKIKKRVKKEFKFKFLPGIIGKWLFEMILSVPLGILLFLHFLVFALRSFSLLVSSFGIKFASAVRFVLEQIVFTVVALAKAVFIIPIKIISIFVALIYRTVGVFGIWLSSFFRGFFEIIFSIFNTLVHPPQYFFKKVFAFAAFAIIFVLPIRYIGSAPRDLVFLKGRVLGSAKEGFSILSSMDRDISTNKLSAAANSFYEAEEKFREARDSIDSAGMVFRSIIQLTPQGSGGIHLISAGEELSQAAALLSGALEPILSPESGTDIISNIRSVEKTLEKVSPKLRSARSSIESIDIGIVPEEYRVAFLEAKLMLSSVEGAVLDFLDLSDILITALGGNGPMRYAVVFQNNNEIRPSGGFIGSLAIVDVEEGKISKMEIPGGGSYDFKGFLTKHVLSPKPLWLVSAHWQLQDANWYPDWPTSAEKIAWFLESASHSSVDGVIAIQASTLKELLSILGPVEFPEEEVVLNSENVIQEMQYAVEISYDKEKNQPKEYIANLAPIILERILSSESSEFLDIMSLASKEILRKNFLIYFRDSVMQRSFEARKWSPTIIQSEIDYLSVINANIGGGKTDGVIEESWSHEIVINEDGWVEAELTIIRHHAGDEDDIFESWNNVNYARVYTPFGSQFVSASGFKPPSPELFKTPEEYYKQDEELLNIEGSVFIDESTSTRINNEFGKTVFGNWIQVMPGGTALSKVRYRLPFRVKPFDLLNPEKRGGYSLIIQKQPGAKSVFFSVVVKYPSNWQVAWKKEVGGGTVREAGSGVLMFEGVLEKDTGFGVLFKKQE